MPAGEPSCGGERKELHETRRQAERAASHHAGSHSESQGPGSPVVLGQCQPVAK